MLNLNIGILGHVDCGKTSLAKAISEVASTAAFDKNPQSQARGITLDLGFSSFCIPVPNHLQNCLTDEKVQLTLVDCPGHASLIRTIIGGAQIIDLILLVVDVTKGIQTQTAECLVIGEITCKNLIVVFNKIDLLEDSKKDAQVEKLRKKVQQVLSTTNFAQAPVVNISANPKDTTPKGIDDLINQLSLCAYVPERKKADPFLFAVDHCFSIKGKGTVMTGTILQGSISVDDVIDMPSINTTKKVKSMQMFKKPVSSASAGDRLGICVTQFDPKLMERGIACAPGLANYIYCGIVEVNLIKHFKGNVVTKSKFHISIGHETSMATITCFSFKNEHKCDAFSFENEFEYTETVNEQTEVDSKQFLLLEFEKPVLAIDNCLLIGSKLDMDIHGRECRIAFWGNLSNSCRDKDYKNSYLPLLKIYKNKRKTGVVERLVNDNTVILKRMFKKETNLGPFTGLKVTFSTGETGIIEGSFGQSGKVKVFVGEGLNVDTLDILKAKGRSEEKTSVTVTLSFKKYVFASNAKLCQ